jgi:RNA polymerase sigma-70 factor (ECF subfamily)
MERGSTGIALREIQTLYSLGTLGGLPDSRLLELFLARGGSDTGDAIAELVRRHGPMVMGVCRRALPGSHDAEDAFQATFLILARRAASIGRREQLASWLHGVAIRTASESRRRAGRRRARERRMMDAPKGEPSDPHDRIELMARLDEELNRLPRRYRDALVACELECRSRREAAQQLGLPEGTLSTHLTRGRKLLHDRLVRRGVSMGIAPQARLSWPVAKTTLVEPLLGSTIQAALRHVMKQTAAGEMSATFATPTAAVLLAVELLLFE